MTRTPAMPGWKRVACYDAQNGGTPKLTPRQRGRIRRKRNHAERAKWADLRDPPPSTP